MTAKKKPTRKKSNSSSEIVHSKVSSNDIATSQEKNLCNNKNNPFVNHQNKGKRKNIKDYSLQQLNEY